MSDTEASADTDGAVTVGLITMRTVTTHVAACRECGWWQGSSATFRGRDMAIRDHINDHVRWKRDGAHLAGKVYLVPTLMGLDAAERAALAEGYGHMEWNGWVYPVGRAPREDARTCRSEDVPGLIAPVGSTPAAQGAGQ